MFFIQGFIVIGKVIYVLEVFKDNNRGKLPAMADFPINSFPKTK